MRVLHSFAFCSILAAILLIGLGCDRKRLPGENGGSQSKSGETRKVDSGETDAAFAAFQEEIAGINIEEKKKADSILETANQRIDTALSLMPFPEQEKSVAEYLTGASNALARSASDHQAGRERARSRFTEKWGKLPARQESERKKAFEEMKAELAALDNEAKSRSAEAAQRKAELELRRIRIEMGVRREAVERRFTNIARIFDEIRPDLSDGEKTPELGYGKKSPELAAPKTGEVAAPKATDVDAPKSVGSVAGTVTFRALPVAKGKVSFHPQQGQPVTAAIIDGRYSAAKVPVGKLTVTVEFEGFEKQFVDLKMYSDPKTSTLRFEVKAGENKFDIQLDLR